ncbi:hypothetical protein [Tessaracoccus coleopterorum]|nr:hypothetical protein [Tessaracoccus coleopterorum]
MLVNLTTLTPKMRDAFLRLAAAVEEFDGISPSTSPPRWDRRDP